MNRARETPTESSYEVAFNRRHGCLVVQVSGRTPTIGDLMAMHRQVATELQRAPVGKVLIIDDSQGVVPDEAGFMQIIDAFRDLWPAGVRVAFVDNRGEALGKVEMGEILARVAGYDLRVFGNEVDAGMWLRHGEE